MSRARREPLGRCSECRRMLVLEESGLCLTCEVVALRERNLELEATLELEHRRRVSAEMQLREMRYANADKKQ